MSDAVRTRHLLDRAFRAMLEADARAGMDAMTAGAHDHASRAEAIGLRALELTAASYGLDADVLLEQANARGELQADATLAAIGWRIRDEAALNVIRGTTGGGVLTGVRLGLMLAELVAQEGPA